MRQQVVCHKRQPITDFKKLDYIHAKKIKIKK